jgi:hypothetical protein
MVRQFNSRTGPVETKNLLTCAVAFAVAFEILSLQSSALRETMVALSVSFQIRFPQYLAVTLSRWVGSQECQHIFVPSRHFFNFRKSQTSQGAKSGE